MKDRITLSLAEIVRTLEEAEYNLQLVRDTAEIEASSKYVRGRFQTASSEIRKAINAIEEGGEGYIGRRMYGTYE